MPMYLFKNPKNGEIAEIFQKIDDEHSFKDSSGLKWERIFTVPFTSVDTRIDPNSSSEFVKKTANKNMNLGELWDTSKELSEKRQKSSGKDPVKEKYFKDYSKKRKGKKHPDQYK